MERSEVIIDEIDEHIVIIGWDEFAFLIADELLASNNKLVLVTESEAQAVDARERLVGEFQIVTHDLKNMMQLSGLELEKARAVFLNLESDQENLVAIVNLKRIFEGVEYVVVLRDDDLADTFKSAGVTYPVSKYRITSKIVASLLFERHVADLMLELISATKSDGDYDIQQFLIRPQSNWDGKLYGEAFREFKSRFNVAVLGVARPSEQSHDLYKIPKPDMELLAGDYLIVANSHNAEAALQREFRVRGGRTTRLQHLKPGPA